MLTEEEFIAMGMTKDKWPHVTVELIRGFTDDPSTLDRENAPDFVECFYKYFDWYWRNMC